MKISGISKRRIIMLAVTAAALLVVAVALIVSLVGNDDVGTGTPERDVLRYGDYEYVINEDKSVGIVGYLGSEKKLELPIMISGRNVSSIGNEAFAGSDITEIVIGIFVKDIGEYAFAECIDLKKVEFSSKLENIGVGAFAGCTALENVEFPAALKSIGEYAFYTCRRFTSITLPETLQSIGAYAFSNCIELESITSPAQLSVGASAFAYCDVLKSVDLPYAVSIGDAAFSNCKQLAEYELGALVSSFGNDVFRACSSLSTISVAEGNSNFEVHSGVLISKSGTAIKLPALAPFESVTLPNHVVNVAYGAFMNNLLLKSVVLPEGLKEIGSHAFYYCDNLEQIVIPSSVSYIGGLAFHGTKFMESQKGELVIVGDGVLIKYNTPLSSTESTLIVDREVNVGGATVMQKKYEVTVPSSVKSKIPVLRKG